MFQMAFEHHGQMQQEGRRAVISVLVVDDSKFMAHAMQTVLEGMDFRVVGIAHDGQQGVESFTAHSPDVTLLDITMPNMDGLQCLSRIREINPDARVVMLSAIRDQSVIDKCIESGASGFLQKPIRQTSPSDLDRLCSTLEKAAGKTL